jgi:hypothetical protein
MAAILQNIEDALQMGYWWEQRKGKYSEWFGLGLDGIYVIWDRNVVKSGFIPGSACFPPSRETASRIENPLPRRDPNRQLRLPSPDSPRRRYELFKTSHFCVCNAYAVAYYNNEIIEAGSDTFVDRNNRPRLGKWQQWLTNRPTLRP